MKKRTYRIVLLIALTSFLVAGCNLTTGQKAETGGSEKPDFEESSLEPEVAHSDSAEYANYKIESEMKLRGNELLIADMKDKLNPVKNESTVKFEKQLDSLDMQNTLLRNNMQMYSAKGKTKWESFKKGFNEKLDALEKSITRLAESNMKKRS